MNETDSQGGIPLSSSVTFKCPSCGGYLTFDPDGQHFECPYCTQSFDHEAVIRMSREAEAASTPLKGYHCQSCGAEIVTGETTAATRCYYCHSPVVLTDRLAEDFRPDGIIPFQLDQKQAENAFRTFLKKKRFVDRAFFDKAIQAEFSGVYYPYWMGDVEGEASFEGEGTRVSVTRTPRHIVTTTRFFLVRREGDVCFRQMTRRALKAADRELAEGVHPYRLEDEKPFAAGYLSGFLAERRDIEEGAAREEMLQEAQEHAHTLMSGREGFDTLRGQTSFRLHKASLRQLLLPVWVMIYKDVKDTYYYMLNGQTGSVCGNLPVDKKKMLAWALGIFAGVFAALCAGGAWLW